MGPQFTTNCFPFLFGLLVWIEARIDIGRLYVAEFGILVQVRIWCDHKIC